jgi:hypothetical protein
MSLSLRLVDRQKQKSPTDPHGSLGLTSPSQTNILGGPAKNRAQDIIVLLQCTQN